MDRREFGKLLAAGVAGVLVGSKALQAIAQEPEDAPDAPTKDVHICAGKNACKGLGGCKTTKNACAGKSACKGQGGCAVPSKTMTSSKPTKTSCAGKGGCGGKNSCAGKE